MTSHGVWIDIFPIDALPDNERERNHFIKKCIFLRALTISMTTDFHAGRLGKKGIAKRALNLFAHFAGRKRIYRYYIRQMNKFDIKKAKYVACLSSAYIKKESMEREILFQQSEFEFEGKIFKGPAQWDRYLKNIYGKYMELPPENERKIHGITAWRV